MNDMLKSSHPETYQIKVSILECRQLKLEIDEVPNPYIIIKIGDQFRETPVIRENPDPIYNFVSDFQLVTTESELKTLKILISVMNNTKWYKRDTVIGIVSVDAWTVYMKSNHMINKVWSVLEKEGVPEAGHLNYSIIVIGNSNKLLALRGEMEDDEEQNEGEAENKKKVQVKDLIQGAPPIEKKSYLMSINIYQGEFCQLPSVKDFNSKVRIIVNEGNISESLVISNSLNPGWKEQFNIPMRSPFYITYIIIEIWTIVSSEKLLGRFVLDFNQLFKDGTLDTKWYLIYGPERENSFMRKLKYQYKFGKEVEHHFYCGRLLVSCKWVPDEAPSAMKYATPDVQFPEERMFIFWLDIYELTSKVLSSGDEIFVECQIGNKVPITKTAAQYNSVLKKFFWTKDIRFKEETLSFPSDYTQIPDIFIRIKKKGGIFSDDEYIGYCRFKAQDLIENRQNVKPKWQKLRMCKTQVKGDADENYLGLLLCSINFFPNPPDNSGVNRPIVIETRNYKKYKLISIIYKANDLPVLNKGSLPSCRTNISFNGKTRKTKIEKPDNNPIWGEVMFISTYLNDCLDLSDNILMEVFSCGLVDTLLGKTEIEVGKIKKYNSQKYIENELYKHVKWYNLFEGTKQLNAKVLASFMIVKLTKQGKEEINLSNKQRWPADEEFRLYLFILGVRGIPRDINLNGGCVMSYLNNEALEELSKKDEKFKKAPGVSYDNNLNVYDVKYITV